MKALLSKLPTLKRPTLSRPDWSTVVLGLGAVSLVVVLLFLLGVPGYRHLKGKAQLAAVRGNAATVQLAAETYAAAHQGRYPTDHLDLIPLLPGDTAPTNPFTGKPVQFRGEPGGLTYRSPTKGGDYVIQAFGMKEGRHNQVLLTLKGRIQHQGGNGP
jgi:type II secretory pathway pseudopilin PulG